MLGPPNRLEAAVGIQFMENMLDVVAYRCAAYAELIRNALCCAAQRKQTQDLDLPRTKMALTFFPICRNKCRCLIRG